MAGMLALPEARAALPIVFAPSRKTTEPVGELPVTLAVSVTVAPNAAGFALVASATPSVSDARTEWVRTGDVLAAFPESPPYTAVIGWSPSGREMRRIAWLWMRLDVPSGVAPSLNVMVPPGLLPSTTAENAAVSPRTELTGPVSFTLEVPGVPPVTV